MSVRRHIKLWIFGHPVSKSNQQYRWMILFNTVRSLERLPLISIACFYTDKASESLTNRHSLLLCTTRPIKASWMYGWTFMSFTKSLWLLKQSQASGMMTARTAIVCISTNDNIHGALAMPFDAILNAQCLRILLTMQYTMPAVECLLSILNYNLKEKEKRFGKKEISVTLCRFLFFNGNL